MDNRERILIVDDEEAIRSALSTFLGRLGYSVSMADSGSSALTVLLQREPDLVLLDVVLDESDPNAMSGLEILRHIRARDRFVPVIMLTSYPEWQVESLGQGAIAFVTKPWDNNALASQIRATLNAVQHIRQESERDKRDHVSQLMIPPDIEIDLEFFRVSRSGEQIDLTPIEFALLVFLARHPNRHWTREQLLDHVWDYSWVGYPRTVDRHIAALRRKLKLERNELIETVHGVGYKLVI
ncbi:MAG: response regulator transcription factor [Chloroflexi bacterium]|nr:response regulator transcription factor [Chloroflexota bacterium]